MLDKPEVPVSGELRLRKWNILDDQIVITLTRAPHDDAEMDRLTEAVQAFVAALAAQDKGA